MQKGKPKKIKIKTVPVYKIGFLQVLLFSSSSANVLSLNRPKQNMTIHQVKKTFGLFRQILWKEFPCVPSLSQVFVQNYDENKIYTRVLNIFVLKTRSI